MQATINHIERFPIEKKILNPSNPITNMMIGVYLGDNPLINSNFNNPQKATNIKLLQ